MSNNVDNQKGICNTCPYHSGITKNLENIEKSLNGEIQERKRVYRNLEEDLHHRFDNINTKMSKDIDGKYKLMNIQLTHCKEQIDLKFESFKSEIEEKMNDFRKIALTFFVASVTLWGSVIGLMIFLFNNHTIK